MVTTIVSPPDPGDLIAVSLGLTNPQLQLIVAALYYVLVFIGSISLGYLVVRFTYSEVRTFTHQRRLLSAAAVGILITLTALGFDYLAFADKALQFNSASMFFTFAATLLFFLILRVYFVISAASRQFVTVGIPVAGAAGPAPSKPAEVKKTIEISKRIEKVKAQIQQAQQIQVELPKGPQRGLQQKPKGLLTESSGNSPMLILDHGNQPTPAPERPTTKPVEAKVKIEQEKGEREEKREKEEKKSREEEAAAREKTARELMEREKERELKKLQGEKEKLENELREQLKKHQAELRKAEAQQQKAEKPFDFTLQVQRTVTAKPGEFIEEKLTGFPEREKKTAGKEEEKKEKIEKVEGKKAETKEVEKPLPSEPWRPERKKSGFFDSIFGGGKPKPSSAPTPAVPQSAQPSAAKSSEFVSWRERGRQAEQPTQASAPGAAKPSGKLIPPREAQREEEQEIEALIKTVVKEAKAEPSGEPQHRRYLMKEQVEVKAAKEVAQDEEFHGAVQEAYSKLQEAKQERTIANVVAPQTPTPAPVGGFKQAQSPQRRAPPTPATQPPVESGISISDILGTDLFAAPAAPAAVPAQAPLPAATAEEHDIFGKLTELSEAKPQKSDVSFVEIKAPGAGCPTCHAVNSKIIFCPYCGSGMCANCSPSIKPLGQGRFVYVCPKCGEEVDVHKR